MAILSGDDIRAGVASKRRGLRAGILRYLENHGPCPTNAIHGAFGSQRTGVVREMLATLVDEGVVVATMAEVSDRPGRAPVIWTLAQAADHTNGED